MKIVF